MKNIQFVFLIFLISGFSQAQQVDFGIVGGLNYSNLDNFFDDNDEPLPAWHLGVIAEFHVAEKLSFEPSVTYSVEGERTTLGDLETDVELYFINVPMHIKYYIFDNFSIHGGPQIGFYVDGDFNERSPERIRSFEVSNNTGSSFAATGGLAYDFDSGLFIKATYNHGVTDVFKNVTRADRGQRTRSFQFSVGFKL